MFIIHASTSQHLPGTMSKTMPFVVTCVLQRRQPYLKVKTFINITMPINLLNFLLKHSQVLTTIINININLALPGLYAKEGDNRYNAFEKDIAVVHFFFQVTITINQVTLFKVTKMFTIISK